MWLHGVRPDDAIPQHTHRSQRCCSQQRLSGDWPRFWSGDPAQRGGLFSDQTQRRVVRLYWTGGPSVKGQRGAHIEHRSKITLLRQSGPSSASSKSPVKRAPVWKKNSRSLSSPRHSLVDPQLLFFECHRYVCTRQHVYV